MFNQFKKKLLLAVLTFTCSLSYCQEPQKINFEDIKYRNVGPTRGGRSTSVCGVIKNEFTFYMGTSGGGLWKTIDGGLSWNNISVMGILNLLQLGQLMYFNQILILYMLERVLMEYVQM